jgi:hypothetical protein
MYVLYACLLILHGSHEKIMALSFSQIQSDLCYIILNLRSMLYGDDGVHNVREDSSLYGKITESALIEAYGKMGLKATSDAKDGSVHTYRLLSEVSFLKRKNRFLQKHGRHVGMLALSSIMKSVQWFENTDPSLDEYKLTLQSALEELSLHPLEVSSYHINFIVKEGRDRLNFVPLSEDYETLQKLCMAREDIF